MPTTTAVSPATRAMAAYELTELIAAYSKTLAWQAACLAYSTAAAAGQTGMDEPRPSRMPSKAAKHRMYGSAHRIAGLLELDVEPPRKLADIGAVISAAMTFLWN